MFLKKRNFFKSKYKTLKFTFNLTLIIIKKLNNCDSVNLSFPFKNKIIVIVVLNFKEKINHFFSKTSQSKILT